MDSRAPYLTVGAVLMQKYRVERVLGRGGMGVVVAARHLELGSSVALKFLLKGDDESGFDAESLLRFQREARAASALKGEHVARIFDVGRVEDGTPMIVMELLDGADLAKVLAQRGPVSVVDAVDWILQACDALAEAHLHGIVHRDIKLGNLFLAERMNRAPLVKVMDFGLAKMRDPTQGDLTQTKDVFGSPGYMSPEQLRATGKVDARTDVWALGVCLYELLTGRLPFEAPALADVCVRILTDAPTPLDASRRDVPPPIAEALLLCLVKQPQDRLADVGELATRIAPFASRRGRELLTSIHSTLAARSRGSADEEATTDLRARGEDTVTPGTHADSPGPANAWSSSQRLRLPGGRATLYGVAAVALVLAAGAVAKWRWQEEASAGATRPDAAHLAPAVTPPSPPAGLSASPASEPPAAIVTPRTEVDPASPRTNHSDAGRRATPVRRPTGAAPGAVPTPPVGSDNPASTPW